MDRITPIIIKRSVGDGTDGILNGTEFGLSSSGNDFDVTFGDEPSLCCCRFVGAGNAIEVEVIVL